MCRGLRLRLRVPDTVVGRREAALLVAAEEDLGQDAGEDVQGVDAAGAAGLGVEADVGVVDFFGVQWDAAPVIVPGGSQEALEPHIDGLENRLRLDV